jgi:MFS family permease
MAAFADYFGLGAISPILPFFVDQFTPGSQDATGHILSFQYGGVILGSLLAGAVSDRIGRRNTLLIMLAGDVVFFTLTGFADDLGGIYAMMAIRFFAGLFTPLAPCIAW